MSHMVLGGGSRSLIFSSCFYDHGLSQCFLLAANTSGWRVVEIVVVNHISVNVAATFSGLRKFLVCISSCITHFCWLSN